MVALLASVAFAAPQLRLEVQPTNLVEGQTGAAHLVIVGGTAGDLQAPARLPAGGGLSVTFASQSQSVRERNGRFTQTREFGYQVAAIAPGDWLVGPVELRLADGTILLADAVPVHVADRASVAPEDRITWVESGFTTERAWEGQVVVYEYKLSTRAVAPVVEWRLPPFDGLRPPQHGQDTQHTYEIDDPGGLLTIEEGAVPFVAAGTGRRTVPPATASVRVPFRARDIFGMGRLTAPDVFVGQPSELDIQPLPPAPPGFSGIVGDVTVTASLDTETAAVGESVDWTVTIDGDASLDGLELPPYAADGVSTYDGDEAVGARVDGDRYLAQGRYERVVVPTREGRIELPDWTIVTFSPTEGRYVTHTVPLGALDVTPGREGKGDLQRFGTTTAPPAAEGEATIDLRPPYATGRASAPSLRAVLPPLLLLAAAPGVGLLLVEVAAWMRARLARREREPVAPRARAVLARLPADPDDALSALDHALRLLELLSPDDAELRELRKRLGRARFGGGPPDATLAADVAAAAERVDPPGRAA